MGYDISPYAYCENNPLSLIDPDGKGPLGGALLGAGLDIGIQIASNLIKALCDSKLILCYIEEGQSYGTI